uniref:Oligomycin sensitivity conferral protein n=1 Tax=Anopheles darlingi TaxID=43151 RepID=A0A2M4CZ33_ANODA
MKKICSYKGCNNTTASNPAVTYFLFPRDPNRYKVWAENSGLTEQDLRSTSARYLCEIHFPGIYQCHSPRRKLLLQTAVPYPYETTYTDPEDEGHENMEENEPEPVQINAPCEPKWVDASAIRTMEMIEQDDLTLKIKDEAKANPENDTTVSLKRKDANEGIGQAKVKMPRYTPSSRQQPSRNEINEYTLQIEDGIMLRKTKPGINKALPGDSKQVIKKLPSSHITDHSTMKSPVTSSTNFVEIIEQGEDTVSIESEDETEESSIHINELVIKGEKYVQMPKASNQKKTAHQKNKRAENKQTTRKIPQTARQLSTSSAAAQLVKPPVQVFGLEGRYACALYSAASKTKALDAVEKDLKGLQNQMRTDPKVRDLLRDPTTKRNVKAAALKDVAAKVKFNAATGNLLTVLAENGRLGRLDGIINAFSLIMAAERGEVVCEVKTAKPLDDGQRKQLENALKAFLKPNQTIQLTAKVDPALIGGMVVSIGDKYVDMSVASKIKKYTDIIAAPV